jgi:hypothetical protein
MKIRRYLTQIYLLGTLLSAASTCSGLAQVLFFDNFQQFANGSNLSSTNYTPASGPATASVVTAVQNGSPTLTVSNFLGNTWALFNNSVPTNKNQSGTNENQYEGILSSVQTNQPLQITWNMWIGATNTGPGKFMLSVPTSDPNTNFNPLIFFTDTGSIIALTNGTNVQIAIGSWGSLAGTVMTNTLILDYPNGVFSYSLNGQTLATLPLGPYFTNVIGAVYFNGFERSAGSLGNRFALADVEVEANVFTYTTGTSTITITGYIGTNTTVIIPGTINGLPVTSIGSDAFENKATLISVTIPSSVTNIGVAAFAYCSSLTSVTIPGSVASISDYAFNSCGSLNSVLFGAGVTNIGNFAFTFDSSLTGLIFPNGVTSIGSNAFEYCTGLTSITIPDSVTSLEDFAFGSCGGLNNVVLGNGVNNIGNFAFTFCTNLTSITIPENVTSIGISAFRSCSNLASVTIDCGNIGDYAFGYCGSLSNVVIGSSVTNIGNFAFTFCNSLTDLTIPNSVTIIEDSAFYSCANLANLTIGGGNIGDYAFGACGSLSSVVISSGVQNVGVGAFADCSSLPSVMISGGVASLGGDAFGADNGLTRIYFLGNAPTADSTVFSGIPGTVYYLPGSTGWTNSFAGLPAVLWNPVIQTEDGSFGVQSNQFGFTITSTANIPVVVEACTNPANPTWIPLLAGTLTNGSLYFSDPAWAYYPERFYRISAQ